MCDGQFSLLEHTLIITPNIAYFGVWFQNQQSEIEAHQLELVTLKTSHEQTNSAYKLQS